MRSTLKKAAHGSLSTLVGVSLATLALSGCATGPAPQSTSASGLSAGNMQLSVHMSKSIFLQPVAPAQRLVYLEGHNTSSAQGLHFSGEITQELMTHGYALTQDPTKADFMLMYNIRYVGKEQHNYTAAGALAGGFGGVVAGALGSNNYETPGYLGLAGAAVGAVVGHFMQHKMYMMVVDLQLEQRQAGVYTTTQTNAQQGTSSTETTSSSGVRNWMIYRDRVVGTASGLNLAFNYATPALSKEVSGEVAGLF